VPISINREQDSVQYDDFLYDDGYNQIAVRKPVSFITAGAWEGQVIVDVITRSLRSRDDLVSALAMCFTELSFDDLKDVGVVIKPISWSSPTESEDRSDKLFRQSLTLDVRTEWRREIPIKNIIDSIFFTVDFGNLSDPNSVMAPNLTINTQIAIDESILGS
jgi:hypothetical protein